MTEETTIEYLERTIAVYMTDGYGLVCMYATERSDHPRTIQTLLRKISDVVHLETLLDVYTYNSLSPRIQLVRPYEAEMKEMSGLNPVGFPDHGLQRLHHPYVGGYPLQKAPLPAERTVNPIPDNRMSGDEVFEIPVGLVHEGIIEPGHFRLSVAGSPS